jgi:hypothetical protein
VRRQEAAQKTATSPLGSEQLHEPKPNPPEKVQLIEGWLSGGHTQAQVGFLAQAAGRVMHEFDGPPPPGVPGANV